MTTKGVGYYKWTSYKHCYLFMGGTYTFVMMVRTVRSTKNMVVKSKMVKNSFPETRIVIFTLLSNFDVILMT